MAHEMAHENEDGILVIGGSQAFSTVVDLTGPYIRYSEENGSTLSEFCAEVVQVLTEALPTRQDPFHEEGCLWFTSIVGNFERHADTDWRISDRQRQGLVHGVMEELGDWGNQNDVWFQWIEGR